MRKSKRQLPNPVDRPATTFRVGIFLSSSLPKQGSDQEVLALMQWARSLRLESGWLYARRMAFYLGIALEHDLETDNDEPLLQAMLRMAVKEPWIIQILTPYFNNDADMSDKARNLDALIRDAQHHRMDMLVCCSGMRCPEGVEPAVEQVRANGGVCVSPLWRAERIDHYQPFFGRMNYQEIFSPWLKLGMPAKPLPAAE